MGGMLVGVRSAAGGVVLVLVAGDVMLSLPNPRFIYRWWAESDTVGEVRLASELVRAGV